MRILEALGRLVGGLWAPGVALGSLLRNARLFHPDGMVRWGRVEPIAKDGMLGDLAKRLEGPVLIRLSSAWWRNDKEWPDVLGMALRLVDSKNIQVQNPATRDQDLLFATIRRGPMLPIAPLFTNVHDFLANDYFALAPFSIQGLGRVKLRLIPMRLPTDVGTRREKLEARIASGTAVLRLEIKAQKIGAKWREVALIEIREKASVDQELLAFNPFRSGRGIVPIGGIHMARAATYKASQWARGLTRP